MTKADKFDKSLITTRTTTTTTKSILRPLPQYLLAVKKHTTAYNLCTRGKLTIFKPFTQWQDYIAVSQCRFEILSFVWKKLILILPLDFSSSKYFERLFSKNLKVFENRGSRTTFIVCFAVILPQHKSPIKWAKFKPHGFSRPLTVSFSDTSSHILRTKIKERYWFIETNQV